MTHTDQPELLRFTTAGSVDDGKSTLIGRLLYDSQSVYEDQLASARRATRAGVAGPLDLSLLTDGLRAEREQGITIDVAYRYFATPRRKFIIADRPGHEQYTRNMATAASTADLAVILIDARRGVLPQSRRHAYIASLLGIPRTIAAINKMDQVEFSEEIFNAIRDEFTEYCQRLGVREGLEFIPLSALEGDNVVSRSTRMPWYQGPSLLERLESIPISSAAESRGLRFPVQYVIRAGDFRGFAGRVAAGALHTGDLVVALPSGRSQPGAFHRDLGGRTCASGRAVVRHGVSRRRDRYQPGGHAGFPGTSSTNQRRLRGHIGVDERTAFTCGQNLFAQARRAKRSRTSGGHYRKSGYQDARAGACVQFGAQ